MKSIRILGALAALLLATGLITACGGSDTQSTESDAASLEEYGQQVEDAMQPLRTELQALGPELSTAGSAQAMADGIGEAVSTLDTVVEDLQTIVPPPEVEKINADLITAISGFSDELAKVTDVADTGNVDKITKAALKLPQAAADFEVELTRIQKAAIAAGVPIKGASGGQ